VLALQHQIGNRAVGAMLARDPKPKTPAKAPAKEPELKDGIWATVPGVGLIELQSAQLGMHRTTTSPVGRGNSREAEAPAVTEIVVTSKLGDHSNDLFRAAMWGEGKKVEIRFVKGGKAYMTITLHQAMITSYNVSGSGGDVDGAPLESWALNAVKIEYKTDQPTAAPPPG
jgi:type VI protein secretion system component Hcp